MICHSPLFQSTSFVNFFFIVLTFNFYTVSKKKAGFRPLPELTGRLTARTYDNHAVLVMLDTYIFLIKKTYTESPDSHSIRNIHLAGKILCGISN